MLRDSLRQLLAVLGSLLSAAVTHWDQPTITEPYYSSEDRAAEQWEVLVKVCSSTAVKGEPSCKTVPGIAEPTGS